MIKLQVFLFNKFIFSLLIFPSAENNVTVIFCDAPAKYLTLHGIEPLTHPLRSDVHSSKFATCQWILNTRCRMSLYMSKIAKHGHICSDTFLFDVRDVATAARSMCQ